MNVTTPIIAAVVLVAGSSAALAQTYRYPAAAMSQATRADVVAERDRTLDQSEVLVPEVGVRSAADGMPRSRANVQAEARQAVSSGAIRATNLGQRRLR